MMGGSDGLVNHCVPLEEEGKKHWLVLGKAGALSHSVEAAELGSHSV